MLGSIRRVDPSRLIQSRYEHPDANQREQPPDDFQEPGSEPDDEEPERAEEDRASSGPLAGDERDQPQLLTNRPILRWLRGGQDDAHASSPSPADRFSADAGHERGQGEIVEHLTTIHQYSLTSILERAALPASKAASASSQAERRSEDRVRDEYEKHHDERPPGSSVDLEG